MDYLIEWLNSIAVIAVAILIIVATCSAIAWLINHWSFTI